MYSRILKPLESKSFLLFGARGTGKSTYLKEEFLKGKKHYYVDLLLPELEDRYRRSPEQLHQEILAKKAEIDWVVIDEVQKIPKLLDLVHHLIENTPLKFALTGSSTRILKRGNANLLAGRAILHHLFPLSVLELGEDFSLSDTLNWGSLPEVVTSEEPEEKSAYLKSYVLGYIKEEIQVEQLVRNLDPFREFLEIAAQSSGKIINYSKIARQVNVDFKTVQKYFQILEDTLLGFILPSYHVSVRKSQLEHPKFYLFDNGVKKALGRTLRETSVPGSSGWGEAFEHFFLQETYRLNQYSKADFRMSFFATKTGLEVDLILSRGKEQVLVEIESADRIDQDRIKKLDALGKDFKNAKVYYVSNDRLSSQYGSVKSVHFLDFFRLLQADNL